MRYEDKIQKIKRLDTAAAKHEEQANAERWEQARLIFEACEEKSQRQVHDDTGLSRITLQRYREVWVRYSGSAGADRPEFNEVMREVRGNVTRSEEGHRATINRMTTDDRVALVEELEDDPVVRVRVQQTRSERAAPMRELQRQYEATPQPVTGVEVVSMISKLSRVETLMREVAQEISRTHLDAEQNRVIGESAAVIAESLDLIRMATEVNNLGR